MTGTSAYSLAAPRPAALPTSAVIRKYSEVYMFSTYRPIAAMMAAVATSVVFTVIELLLRYAAR
jgi:hypothetical protein